MGRREGGNEGRKEGEKEEKHAVYQYLTLFISNMIDGVVSLHHSLLGVAAARASLPLLGRIIH